MTSAKPRRYTCAALVAVLAAVLSMLGSATTGVAAMPRTLPASRTVDHRVFMVGDSITYMGTDNLRALGVRWEISGVPGRIVDRLPALLQRRLAAGPPPAVVVVALGANAARDWHEIDYLAAVAMLPASTRVVFVSVYRNPALYRAGVTPYRQNPDSPAEYTAAMHDIARVRPQTCVVPWRAWAKAHRWTLSDGVHPHGHAQDVWARMVRDTVRACTA